MVIISGSIFLFVGTDRPCRLASNPALYSGAFGSVGTGYPNECFVIFLSRPKESLGEPQSRIYCFLPRAFQFISQ